jgi:cytochrome c peroxidase
VRKTIFFFFIAFFPLAFLVENKNNEPQLEATQAYIELLPNERYAEAAIVFDNLSAKTQNPTYKNAADYIRSHTTRGNFDFALFYRQFLTPSVSIFNWAFSEPKNAPKNTSKNTSKNVDFNKKRAELGHLLFYDPILSANVKRSCASCHRPEKAFCDQRMTSRAFAFAENLDKNAPSLINSTQQTLFFHEGNHRELAQVFEAVVTSPKEFNNSYESITARLNNSNAYLTLLQAAFPNKTTFGRTEIDESLVQFLKILRGYDSPFDRFMNDPKATIVPPFIEGFNLFMGKAQCGTCHRLPSFGGSHLPFFDGHVVYQIDDKSLKTPSLRNSNLSFPYLYNGKINDIKEIFDEPFHLKKLFEKQVVILPSEKDKIIAFLNNLNDAPALQASEPASLPLIKNFETRTIGGKY